MVEVKLSSKIIPRFIIQRVYTDYLAPIRESVVNSLEAGSTDINIFLSKNEIRIKDDGSGIPNINLLLNLGDSLKYGSGTVGQAAIGITSYLGISKTVFFISKTNVDETNTFKMYIIGEKIFIEHIENQYGELESNGTTVILLLNKTNKIKLEQLVRYLQEILSFKLKTETTLRITVNENDRTEIVTASDFPRGRRINLHKTTRKFTISGVIIEAPEGGGFSERRIKIYCNGIYVGFYSPHFNVYGEINCNELYRAVNLGKESLVTAQMIYFKGKLIKNPWVIVQKHLYRFLKENIHEQETEEVPYEIDKILKNLLRKGLFLLDLTGFHEIQRKQPVLESIEEQIQQQREGSPHSGYETVEKDNFPLIGIEVKSTPYLVLNKKHPLYNFIRLNPIFTRGILSYPVSRFLLTRKMIENNIPINVNEVNDEWRRADDFVSNLMLRKRRAD